jgi:hypothetical protein
MDFLFISVTPFADALFAPDKNTEPDLRRKSPEASKSVQHNGWKRGMI